MIESVDDFRKKVSEIDILITYSERNKKDLEKFRLFNKVSIVLLCSHFEAFVESFIAEHVDALRASYHSDTLPQYMKDNYINDTIRSLNGFSEPSKRTRPLSALFKLHDSKVFKMTDISDLEIDMKYSYGKHGQQETEKLFKKFGFKSFVESSGFQEPFRQINSAISIRNTIIHEGSAPSLSLLDVKNCKSAFLGIVKALEEHVINNQLVYYGRTIYNE